MNVGDFYIIASSEEIIGAQARLTKLYYSPIKVSVLEITKETTLLKNMDNGTFFRVLNNNIGIDSGEYRILEKITDPYGFDYKKCDVA